MLLRARNGRTHVRFAVYFTCIHVHAGAKTSAKNAGITADNYGENNKNRNESRKRNSDGGWSIDFFNRHLYKRETCLDITVI